MTFMNANGTFVVGNLYSDWRGLLNKLRVQDLFFLEMLRGLLFQGLISVLLLDVWWRNTRTLKGRNQEGTLSGPRTPWGPRQISPSKICFFIWEWSSNHTQTTYELGLPPKPQAWELWQYQKWSWVGGKGFESKRKKSKTVFWVETRQKTGVPKGYGVRRGSRVTLNLFFNRRVWKRHFSNSTESVLWRVFEPRGAGRSEKTFFQTSHVFLTYPPWCILQNHKITTTTTTTQPPPKGGCSSMLLVGW